jgi:predicted lipoprotein with Yx(FWY)xxD motif
MRRLFWPVLVVAGITLAACGGGTGTATSPTPTASPAAAADVTTASVTISGTATTVLKTPKGLTLYYFTADTSAKVACSGGCASNWPPLLATSDSPTASPALPGKLTVLNGANGKQILYNGHPLYTFKNDSAATDVLGQGIGGKWFAVTPDVKVMAAAGYY